VGGTPKFRRRRRMVFDQEKEKEKFKKELENGEFDIFILPNTEADYQETENEDLATFKEYLKSDDAESLASEVLRK
jgi:hypothetical protein